MNAKQTNMEGANEFLKLIASDKNFVINECDGSEILADANDLFAYIDPNFKKWDTDEKGSATEKIPVDICKIKKKGTFTGIFGSLFVADIRKLCLTQNQIKSLVKKYYDYGWLQGNNSHTFFLLESRNNFFVICVYSYRWGVSDLDVYIYKFADPHLWEIYSNCRNYIVIPKHF